MILTYSELVELIELGVIRGARVEHVNPSSIDVHLANNFMVETKQASGHQCIDVAARQNLSFETVVVGAGHYYTIRPKEFLLASTVETFHLPPTISALFVMKSSVARCGLDQMNAAWCSPGWTGSSLTLELYNATNFHSLMLRPGMAIGQMVFLRGTEVPAEYLYNVRGTFNDQPRVSPAS